MWAPGPVSLHQMSTIEFNALLFQVYLCDHAAYVAHLWAPRGLAACLGRSAHLNPNYHWIWLKKSVNDAVCSNSGSNSLIFPLRWYCTQDWTNIRCYWNNINIHQLQELSKTFFFKQIRRHFGPRDSFPSSSQDPRPSSPWTSSAWDLRLPAGELSQKGSTMDRIGVFEYYALRILTLIHHI